MGVHVLEFSDLVAMIKGFGVTVKPGLWTVDWTMDWSIVHGSDDHYQFQMAHAQICNHSPHVLPLVLSS